MHYFRAGFTFAAGVICPSIGPLDCLKALMFSLITMEHSVQANLERRTSVELVNFPEMCMLRNEWDRYADTIPDIFAFLNALFCRRQ